MKTRGNLLVAVCGIGLLALLLVTVNALLPQHRLERQLLRTLSKYDQQRTAYENAEIPLPKTFPAPVLASNSLPILTRWLNEEPSREPLLHQLLDRISLPDWAQNWINTHYNSRTIGQPNSAYLALIGFELMGTNAASAIPILAARLKDRPEDGSTENLVSALICIGPPAVPIALNLTKSTNAPERSHGAYLLGALAAKPKDSVPELLRLAHDTNQETRSAAFTALAEFPKTEIDPFLRTLLYGNETAFDAAYALHSGGANRIPLFLDALANSNRNVRVAALAALSSRETFAKIITGEQPRYRSYAGKKCLFNSHALQASWLMYANNDQEELFASLRKNYAQTGDTRIQDTIRTQMEKRRVLLPQTITLPKR